MARFTYRPFRPAGRFRAQSWLGTGEPTKPVTPPKPLPVYSGRHSDGTAHQINGCYTCGIEGYLSMDEAARQPEESSR